MLVPGIERRRAEQSLMKKGVLTNDLDSCEGNLEVDVGYVLDHETKEACGKWKKINLLI